MNITMDSARALIESQAKRHEIAQQHQVRITPSHKDIPEHYKQVASYVFNQLTTMRPAWKIGFTNQDKTLDQKQVTAYKIQLLKAMESNKIDSLEKVEIGLNKLRSEAGQFLPSVGDFVTACKSSYSGEHNAAMYQEFRPDRLLMPYTEAERKQIGKENVRKLKELMAKPHD